MKQTLLKELHAPAWFMYRNRLKLLVSTTIITSSTKKAFYQCYDPHHHTVTAVEINEAVEEVEPLRIQEAFKNLK